MSATLEVYMPSGLTLSVDLFPFGSDTRDNGAGDSLTEAANRKGLYAATIAEALTGWHTAHVYSGANLLAVFAVRMVNGETCRAQDLDDWGRKLAEAQRLIDPAPDPWQLLLKDRDTGAELIRWDLKDDAGASVDDIEDFVAQQLTP